MKLVLYETFFIAVVCITVPFLSCCRCQTTDGPAGSSEPATETVTFIDTLEPTTSTAAATTSTTTKLNQPTTGTTLPGDSSTLGTTMANDSSTVGSALPDGTSVTGTSRGGNSTDMITESTGNISMTTEGKGATRITTEVTKGTTNIGATRGTASSTDGTTKPTGTSPVSNETDASTTKPTGSNPVTDETDASTRVDDKTSVTSTKSPETSTVTTTTEQQTTQPPLRTTEAISSPRVTTRLPEPQSPTPNYPEATFPKVEASIPVFRQIAVEVAVNNANCEDNNLEGESCDALKEDFETFAGEKYENISGYVGITIIALRKGSVIIQHQVFYDYNKMTSADRQLSAGDIYERTLAPSIESTQKFGNSTFTECTDCTDTQELIDLCNEAIYSVTCEAELEATCSSNTWRCESPCANTETLYCSEKSAFCRQEASDKIPTCSCLQSDEGWYIGAKCQFYVDRLWLIVGFSVGSGVVLIIILILIICLCQTRKELKESRKMPYEKTNEAFLMGNDHLQIDNAVDSHEMDEFVNGTYITDDDEAPPKPYSYVYAADVGADYGRKGSKDVRPFHENNPELDRALHERAITDNKKPSQSFWGNLEHEVISEIPNTTGQNQINSRNVNESKAKGGKQQANGYPQKRPQSAAIPPADYEVSQTDPFNKRYSQIVSDDYGKSKKKH